MTRPRSAWPLRKLAPTPGKPLLLYLEDSHIIENRRNPPSRLWDESNAYPGGQIVSPGAAARSFDAIATRISDIYFRRVLLAAHDSHPRPVAGRADNAVAVTRESCRSRSRFLGIFDLARALNREVDELDVIVVIAIDHESGLRVIDATTLGREDRQKQQQLAEYDRLFVREALQAGRGGRFGKQAAVMQVEGA